MNSFEIGRFGEEYAAKLLRKQGYRIITQNFKCTVGEIDLIVKNKTEIIFVEVKARRSDSHGTPMEYINKNKIHHLSNAANYFMKRYSVTLTPRFDVIELYISEDKPGKLAVTTAEHLEKVIF